ncbi:CLECT [Nesidiocoris tenuis]|uniref:CLECT n=1 Tax=Nesidiocoris tenuis TaxID=355587 RepID=A0ABN7AAD8_9HEMI|nr:CLECT [Nesidiocoris tenuis]
MAVHSGLLFLLVPGIIMGMNSQQQSVLRCSQASPPQEIRYHFSVACKQSTMKSLGSKSVSTVQECRQMANKRRAFAFDFVHKALLHPSALNFSKDTCVLYECPDFDLRRSEQSYSAYDYYSSYAMPRPKFNVSCIPKVGIFQLHRERRNYDNASSVCEEEGGLLADVSTDLYTTQLSSLIASLNVTAAYVGLKHWNASEGEFITSKGLPLSCSKFRAWAPSEPRPIKQSKCVYLTSKGYWRVKDCSKKQPFLCELLPQGPMKPCQRIKSQKKRARCIRKYLSSLPRRNRYPKCGDPSQRNQNRRRRRRKKQKNNSTMSENRVEFRENED